MFKINPLHSTDSYKLGHRNMYPKGTELVFSNMTARSDRLFKDMVPPRFYDGKLVVFGIQAVVKNMIETWKENFFDRKVDEVVAEYSRRISPFVGDNVVTEDHIRALHSRQSLPIEVHGLEDGTVAPFKIPVFVIYNTEPEFYWLTNYLETYFSNEFWKASTSATIARYYRKIVEHWASVTGTPKEFCDWQVHDFSCRGMSGMMDAASTGSGHLTQFTGTDTLVAVDFLEHFYDCTDEFIGGSVPASEHSVMTMGGPEGELELFRRLITKEYPKGIVSLVSDSYDFWKVITEYATVLKDDILSRGEDAFGNAKVVFRPDSGDPVRIICGYDEDEIQRHDDGRISVVDSSFSTQWLTELEVKGAVACLWDVFGGTLTTTNHKQLDSHVGLIYGDSITMNRANEILERLERKGFASGNVVFGVGSYTYNYLTRDTLGFAVKATYGIVDGVGRKIFKAPKTDNGSKHSARGCVTVCKDASGELVLRSDMSFEEYLSTESEYISYTSDTERNQKFGDVRKRARA